MYAFFRRVWKPTPTSPFNPYAGRDDRTISARVVSGLRLGGGLVAGFLVVAVAGAGVHSSERLAISVPMAAYRKGLGRVKVSNRAVVPEKMKSTTDKL